MILVGNKCDLKDERKVSKAHIEHMKDQLGVQKYIETSALTGDNVDDMFTAIAKMIYNDR